MSGQTLIDVVSNVVDTMVRKPLTIRERMHQYVIEYAEWRKQPHPENTNLDVHTFPPTDPFLRSFVFSRSNVIEQYVESRHNVVQQTFAVDDNTSLRNEYNAFRSFLCEHQYSTVFKLMEMGFDLTTIKTTMHGRADDESPLQSCMTLWDTSRVLSNRPDVSVGVFDEMSDLIEDMVKTCVRTRKSLTDNERKELIAQELERRYKVKWTHV